MKRRFQLLPNVTPLHIRLLVPEKVRQGLDFPNEIGKNFIYSQSVSLIKDQYGQAHQHMIYKHSSCSEKEINFCVKIANHITSAAFSHLLFSLIVQYSRTFQITLRLMHPLKITLSQQTNYCEKHHQEHLRVS